MMQLEAVAMGRTRRRSRKRRYSTPDGKARLVPW
jgi:hypothetical protein